MFDASVAHCSSSPMSTGDVHRVSVVPFTNAKYVHKTLDKLGIKRNRHEAQTMKKDKPCSQ